MLALAVISGAGALLGGEIGRFATTGVQYIPFILLALIGTLGLYYQWAMYASYAYALLMQGAIAYLALSYGVLGVAGGAITPENLNLSPTALLQLAGLALALLLLFGLCSLVLLPPVRQWLARFIPIDPAKLTHTLALWVVLYMTTTAFAQLIILGGNPPLLTAINSGALSSDDLGSRDGVGQSLDLVYGLIWMLPLALIAAGYPLARDLRGSLQRLGLVAPTWAQLALGSIIAFALAVSMQGFGLLIDTIWSALGWVTTDDEAFAALLGDLLSPVGAIVIGVTAGLGEELAVRGLLQPRVGLLLSNLAFTALHAYQYSFDALLIVFVLGLLLGHLRHLTNTTTAAVVHGGYNALIVLFSLIEF